MKNLFMFLMLSSYLFIACDSNGSKASEEASNQQLQQQLWDEVMVIHDDVMPKRTRIAELNHEISDWAVTNKETMAGGDLERVSFALKQLNQADDGMMEWMNRLQQLDGLRAENEHEAIMTYLNEQKDAITKVKKDMLESIENGEKLMVELTAE